MKPVSIFILMICFSSLYAARFYKDEQRQNGLSITNGYFVSLGDMPTMEVEEHYAAAVAAYEDKKWEEAAKQFRIVKLNFYSSPLAHDATFFLGECYYNNNDLDLANEEFSDYLKTFLTPKYFQKAIDYKFMIAERFKRGEGRHVFGVKSLPKWFNGKALAVEIYDEVIAAMPAHENAAQGLYAKGLLLNEMKDFKESVESFQTLIKRFPRHELASESFLMITKVYLDQCQYEFQNPDLITFAEINLKKFELEFPREPRIEEMKENVAKIKEVYANGLYETGRFYERTENYNASLFYYRNVMNKFPETQIAKKCGERLEYLDKRVRKFYSDPRDARLRNERVRLPRQTA